ncbi:uncharacterized protein [Epargyreus clarus]|uniref:uncharacterized protein n=1 Tax=Epargyreus clarus TaxID=520877 RepID=UPI003C2EFB21
MIYTLSTPHEVLIRGLSNTNWTQKQAYVLHTSLNVHAHGNKRQRRYLLFTKGTQWGVFATISVPLEPPETTVSMAWFFEANYYAVDNSTYLEPLLGDIEVTSRRKKRYIASNSFLTRKYLYNIIEGMLAKHGYHGRSCLLRAICESSTSHFLHNGVLGDILHLILTPSTSMQENLEDCYYEAEYWGLEDKCGDYETFCSNSPLDYISIRVNNIL